MGLTWPSLVKLFQRKGEALAICSARSKSSQVRSVSDASGRRHAPHEDLHKWQACFLIDTRCLSSSPIVAGAEGIAWSALSIAGGKNDKFDACRDAESFFKPFQFFSPKNPSGFHELEMHSKAIILGFSTIVSKNSCQVGT